MRPWTDTSVPLAERVESLLSEMTLDEKLAQLGSVWVGAQLGSGNVAPMQEAFADPLSFEQASAHGLGHLTRPAPGPWIRSKAHAASPRCSRTLSRARGSACRRSRTTSA